jgi:ATP-dependent Lon protease
VFRIAWQADPAADGDPGEHDLGGNIVPVENLAASLQMAFDAGAKRILLPMASAKD